MQKNDGLFYFSFPLVFWMLIYLLSKSEGNRTNSLRVITLRSVCFKRKNLFEKTVLRKMSCFANKLCAQMPSTGFLDNWANQSLESILPIILWWNNLHANLKKTLCFTMHSVFMKWVWQNGKNDWTLERLGEENKQKRGGWSNCAIFQWLSMSL